MATLPVPSLLVSDSLASASSSAWPSFMNLARLRERLRGVSLQRRDQLRHDAAQVADQRHVDRAVDADRSGVLLDIDPLADGLVLHPVAPAAVVHRLAKLGAECQAQVRFRDRFDRGIRKDVLEGAIFEALDVRRAARRLDDRAVHQFGQLLHRRAAARGVHAVADQQDRVLGLANQFHRFGDLVDVRALVDQAIARRRQRLRHVEFFENDVRWDTRCTTDPAYPTSTGGSPRG